MIKMMTGKMMQKRLRSNLNSEQWLIEQNWHQWYSHKMNSLILLQKNWITSQHTLLLPNPKQVISNNSNTTDAGEVIVLGYFAENYSFFVLDEIQGYHRNKNQCSLHPAVVYIRSSNNLVESSLCILSENLNQDVAFVYKVIKETVDFIKKELNLSVKTIH